jgi:hypothetical protein
MEFEGILEEFQGIVDLELRCQKLGDMRAIGAQHTWMSFVMSTSSSMFSSGSTLMAAKVAYKWIG